MFVCLFNHPTFMVGKHDAGWKCFYRLAAAVVWAWTYCILVAIERIFRQLLIHIIFRFIMQWLSSRLYSDVGLFTRIDPHQGLRASHVKADVRTWTYLISRYAKNGYSIWRQNVNKDGTGENWFLSTYWGFILFWFGQRLDANCLFFKCGESGTA